MLQCVGLSRARRSRSCRSNGSVIRRSRSRIEAGLLIDTARAEPVMIEKHGRPVAVVLSVEEYECLASPEGRSEKARRYSNSRLTGPKNKI